MGSRILTSHLRSMLKNRLGLVEAVKVDKVFRFSSLLCTNGVQLIWGRNKRGFLTYLPIRNANLFDEEFREFKNVRWLVVPFQNSFAIRIIMVQCSRVSVYSQKPQVKTPLQDRCSVVKTEYFYLLTTHVQHMTAIE